MQKNNDKTEEGPEDAPESLPETDLKPKPPPKLAPQGIRTFTVARRHDETGVSGEGVVIEGVTLATGQCMVHWLYPPPRGGIAIFDSMSDFVKVHILKKNQYHLIGRLLKVHLKLFADLYCF